MSEYVDYSRFILKTKAVKQAVALTAATELLRIASECQKAVDRNLSGDQINPNVSGAEDDRIGTMPVPRRTGNLSRALTWTKVSSLFHAIWMNPQIAPYAKWVHWGTKKMRPRRFMSDVISSRGPAWSNQLKYKLILAIRNVGQR